MKYFTLILCFLFIEISYSQTKFANIETFKAWKFPYDTLSTCANIWMSSINCATYHCTGDLIEISLSNGDPDAEDSEKQIVIDSISSDINNLISTAHCNPGKSFYLQLGEGIFIKKSDKLTGKKYLNKAWKLNLARFVEKFGKKISEAFPKNKIYVVEWGW